MIYSYRFNINKQNIQNFTLNTLIWFIIKNYLIKYLIIKRLFLQKTTFFRQLLIFITSVSFYPCTIIYLQGLISHQNVNNSEFSISDNVHRYS